MDDPFFGPAFVDVDEWRDVPVRHRYVSRPSVRLETTHVFEAPGTYFPSVRVTAHRDVDVDAAHCRVLDLGRVRVVVR